MLRILPCNIVQDLFLKFNLQAKDFGLFSGIYYIGYALSHIPLALLIDKYGSKKIISFSCLCCVVGFVPLIATDNWLLAIMGRFVVGLGSSGAAIGLLSVLNLYFPKNMFAKLLGISVTMGMMGAIYGSKPMSDFVQILGWEKLVLILIIIGVGLSLAIFIITPNENRQIDQKNIIQELKVVVLNYKVIIIAACGGLMVGPLEGFADAWGVEFFKSVYGLSHSISSGLLPYLFLGMCVGLLTIPTIADKYKIQYGIILFSAIIMVSCFFAIIFMKLDVFVVRVMLALAGIFCSYQSLILYINTFNAPEKFANLTLAVTNMIIMSFGWIFHIAIASVINSFWDGSMDKGILVYSIDAYKYGATVIPLCLIVALIILLLMRRTQNLSRY